MIELAILYAMIFILMSLVFAVSPHTRDQPKWARQSASFAFTTVIAVAAHFAQVIVNYDYVFGAL